MRKAFKASLKDLLVLALRVVAFLVTLTLFLADLMIGINRWFLYLLKNSLLFLSTNYYT